MTSRTYDVILKTSNAQQFTSGNVLIGSSSNAVGVIAQIDTSNNTLKVKLANTLAEFIVGETIHSNTALKTTNANAYFQSTKLPYVSNSFAGNTTTGTATITSITPSSFIAEKNAFTQNPVVRLYTLYFPGEWYPPNSKGNPSSGQGIGRAWPNDFPIRFGEILGDTSRDIQYNVTYGGKSFIPFPVNMTGLEQSNDGKVNEATVTIFNVDNLISRLVEDPYLVGNNNSNAIQAIVQSEWVHGIDPRTVNAEVAAWTTEFGSGDERTILLSQARSNGLDYDDTVVTSYGRANANFTKETTAEVAGNWKRQKLDSRDLLGGILEIKTTFANFLDFWPEYSLIKTQATGNSFTLLNSLPYRIGDNIKRPGSRWSHSTITSVTTDDVVTVDRPFARYLPIGTYEATPRGLTFSSDGANAYVVGSQNDRVYQFRLTTPWDIGTASHLQNTSFTAHDSLMTSIVFDSSGSNLYLIGYSLDSVIQFSLSSKWNIQTASLTTNLALVTYDTYPLGIAFSNTGANLYITGLNRNNVTQLSLSTPWKVDTASFISNTSIASQISSAQDIQFNTAGTKLFILDNTRDSVYTYSLATPWATSSMSFESNVSIAAYTSAPYCMSLGEGGNLYIGGISDASGVTDNNVFQLRLSSMHVPNSYYTAGSTWGGVDVPVYIINDKADSYSYVEDKLKIDQLEGLNEYVATFGLVSWLQYFKMVTPRRKYYKNTCQWVYRGAECQYPASGTGAIAGKAENTANGWFTANNTVTSDSSSDVCAKSYTACELRGNFLRFGGFPGVGRSVPRM